jgi:hypothetical protein
MDADQAGDWGVASATAGSGELSGGRMIPVALVRLLRRVVDAVGYHFTHVRLRLLDRILGPLPETHTDRAIREEGERLRKAFPQIDFDDPKPRIEPPPKRC